MIFPAVVLAGIPAYIVHAIFGSDVATAIVFIVLFIPIRYLGIKAADEANRR